MRSENMSEYNGHQNPDRPERPTPYQEQYRSEVEVAVHHAFDEMERYLYTVVAKRLNDPTGRGKRFSERLQGFLDALGPRVVDGILMLIPEGQKD
jgi:hypothetical protein